MDLFSDLKSFIDDESIDSSFRHRLLFCLWCNQVLNRNLDIRWRNSLSDSHYLQAERIVSSARDVLFSNQDFDHEEILLLEQSLSKVGLDDLWVQDELDEYLFEVGSELWNTYYCMCRLMISGDTKQVTKCALQVVSLVDAEPLAGTIDIVSVIVWVSRPDFGKANRNDKG